MQKIARLGTGQGLHGDREGARPGREERSQLVRRGLCIVRGLSVRRERVVRAVEPAVALQAPAQRLLAVLLYQRLPEGAQFSAQGCEAATHPARTHRGCLSMQDQQCALLHFDAVRQSSAIGSPPPPNPTQLWYTVVRHHVTGVLLNDLSLHTCAPREVTSLPATHAASASACSAEKQYLQCKPPPGKHCTACNADQSHPHQHLNKQDKLGSVQ